MRLYESLVGNVGIGKKYIIQQWIDSNPEELSVNWGNINKYMYGDSTGISQKKDGFYKVYFRPNDNTPDFVRFNNICNMVISSGFDDGPRPKYPEIYTPKHISHLEVFGWDLRRQKLDFDCDSSLMDKHSVRGFDKQISVVEFQGNIWGNTTINIKNGAFKIGSIFHLQPNTVIHTDTLVLDNLNTTRYTSSKRVTEMVNIIVSSKNFPDLTTIYADNGKYTKSGNMWVFEKNK